MKQENREKCAPRPERRSGLAAVEAAVCLPVLVIVWLGAFEANQILSLKQQGQLLSATAASRVVGTDDEFSEIETDIETFSASIGITGCNATFVRLDPEVVESRVEIEYSQNSPIASIFSTGVIVNSSYSYREE